MGIFVVFLPSKMFKVAMILLWPIVTLAYFGLGLFATQLVLCCLLFFVCCLLFVVCLLLFVVVDLKLFQGCNDLFVADSDTGLLWTRALCHPGIGLPHMSTANNM